MLLFFKLVDETQIYEPLEATRHHDLIKLLILLPVRTNLLCTLQCETSCSDSIIDFLANYFLENSYTANSSCQKEKMR